MPVDALIDMSPGVIRVARPRRGRMARPQLRRAVVHRRDREVEQRRGHQDWLQARHRSLERLRRRFGFGRAQSPDFPGENPGIVWSREKWTDSALASVSMGYQIGVTPLQMVTAVSSVANGGQLMEPRAIRAVYHDHRRIGVTPRVLRQSITGETAAVLTGIMEQVVERGTAKAARIPGYTIAGKTGTASKLVNGRYSKSENNVSFVGFVPSRKPVVAIIVVIDGPHAGGTSGGAVSAPVFKRIAEATLRYLGVPPNGRSGPACHGRAHGFEGGRADLRSRIRSRRRHHHGRAAWRSARPARPQRPRCHTGAREARAQTAHHGDGVVVSQEPAPGTPSGRGGAARIVLDRKGPPVVPLPGVAQP